MEDASFTSYGSLSSGSSAGEIESDLGREALREICCSVLSRVLDLSDNRLEVLLGEDESAVGGGSGCIKREDSGSNVAKNIANKLRSLSHRLKFDENDGEEEDGLEGSDFPTLSFGEHISSDSEEIILQLISHMEKFTLEEGLFRKPGSQTRVQQLVNDLETLPFESIIANESYSPHDFASVIKQYLSSLPEPLMTSRHREAYRQAADMSCDTTQTLCLQLLVLLLPPAHHTLLSHLLQFLSTLSHSKESRMDAHNLSVVFAPTLFFNMKCSDSVVPELIPKMMCLLQHMIKHSTDIFEIPTEVRVVAERYIRRRGNKQKEEDVPIDMYSSSCQQVSLSAEEFHQKGRENATAELASLYEYVYKMPEGPQKQHFLKKFGSTTKMAKMAGSPAPYVKSKKSKENFTPKIKLREGVGSHQIKTPMRPSFHKGSIKLDSKSAVQLYATPLKPKANLMEYQKLETDV